MSGLDLFLYGGQHQGISGPSGCVWLLQRRTASGCICIAENNWILFTLGQRKIPGEEADTLREYLNELKTDLAMGDQDTVIEDQLDRERFLEEYPRMKEELEEGITKLYALAEKADKLHRDCTISHVAAHSAGTVSGVLTILGLSLAPVTMGASLALLATGLGLGAAAAVTDVSTTIVERVSTLALETEASRYTSTADSKEEVFEGVVSNSTAQFTSSVEKVFQAMQGIENNVRAIKVAKGNPGLAASAKRFTTTGQVSAKRGKQVQKAFGGTALAMTQKARIQGVASAGLSLLMEVAFLVKEAKHLHEGAKTEPAERLRQKAQELEKKLEELTDIYESLQ
ncbi:apolipoprotein L2-like [Pseudorca crassidens]|uniref:apolipoprotein L2-like n=1 Tax=Pseudorca crassidens TaxID=82174 RepID=UPI00352BD460